MKDKPIRDKSKSSQLDDRFRINSLEAQLKAAKDEISRLTAVLDAERDSLHQRFLSWRGLNGLDVKPCTKCDGSGRCAYGSTSTWSGGAGGQMITDDVCDKCWGSGDDKEPGVNLRRLRGEQRMQEQNLAILDAVLHEILYFSDTVERAEQHATQKGGQQVSYQDDFAHVPPSTRIELRRWVARFDAASKARPKG